MLELLANYVRTLRQSRNVAACKRCSAVIPGMYADPVKFSIVSLMTIPIWIPTSMLIAELYLY